MPQIRRRFVRRNIAGEPQVLSGEAQDSVMPLLGDRTLPDEGSRKEAVRLFTSPAAKHWFPSGVCWKAEQPAASHWDVVHPSGGLTGSHMFIV